MAQKQYVRLVREMAVAYAQASPLVRLTAHDLLIQNNISCALTSYDIKNIVSNWIDSLPKASSGGSSSSPLPPR